MGADRVASRWNAFGRSVRGAIHERRGLPNQDAISWRPNSGVGPTLTLALADGHGSARYTRSHIGARLAVETSTQLIQDFVARHQDAKSLSVIKRTAEEWLPQALLRVWLDAVTEHLNRNSLSEVELRDLGLSKEPPAHDPGRALVAYGTTLIAVAVAEAFVIYLQLGDGEILTVTDQSQVGRPLARDDRLFANETTSLCAPEAWRDFRVAFQPTAHARPALILLATDGYPNSFRDESGFLKAGSDIFRTIQEEGFGRIKASLEGWLKESTDSGSGDDVTVGVLCALQPKAKSLRKGQRSHRVRSKGR